MPAPRIWLEKASRSIDIDRAYLPYMVILVGSVAVPKHLLGKKILVPFDMVMPFYCGCHRDLVLSFAAYL